jgi:hypothetical protein
MSVIAALIPPSPTLYSAKQVRQVLPNGVIQFVDGSAGIYLVTPQGQTFVPTSNLGNYVPNVSDWILAQRPTLNTADGGPGQQSVASEFQLPVTPSPFGPFIALTAAQFQANYNLNYALGAPNQGIVP